MRFTYLLSLFIIFTGCRTTQPFYNTQESGWESKQLPDLKVNYSVFLLGDLGDPSDSSNEILTLLQNHTEQLDSNHAIVFLSLPHVESVPQHGNDNYRSESETTLSRQLNYLIKDKGKLVFIPGNHEVVKGKKNRKESLQLTKAFVENKLGRTNIFFPENGCPGPAELTLTDDLILVPMNTLWWLQDKDERNNDCEIKKELDWMNELKDILDNNQRKNILVLGYHPILDVGNHGGYFSLKQHVFPFTDLHRSLYLPLPIVGSLYPIYRAGIGTKHDFAYPRYKKLRDDLFTVFEGYTNVVYASAHEHNLQYFKSDKQDFIITNSSNDVKWVGRKNNARFTYAEKGFAKLSYFQNGEVWMEIFVPDKNNTKAGSVVYRKRLKDNVYGKPKENEENHTVSNYSDSSITMAANAEFKAGAVKQFLWGKHYREAWTTPLSFKVFDFKTEEGGLVILKKGGGMQTRSLRLQNQKGQEFVIRSVLKYPDNLLPKSMLKTFVADIVRDQTSTKHPYGTQVVEALAETAGILHTNSKTVYVPNDTILAEYRKDFGNTLMLFEQRPAGDLSGMDNFANAKQAISSAKMFKNLRKDNRNAVDKYLLIKNRLFDMWINDWDRHEDQWKWAVIKCEPSTADLCFKNRASNELYLPIPRDRDQAFTKFDGVFPWFAGRKWTGRKFQTFGNDIRDIAGFNYNSRFVDEALLTGLSLNDWLKAADDLKTVLTDEQIEAAVHQWPEAIFNLDGNEIIAKLKSRRNKLESFANRYYRFLAIKVDVTGSDENELFLVNRLNDDSTSLKIFDMEKGVQGALLYDRTFRTGETDELRIYGLGGDDVFKVTGQVDKSILIRIIGGAGKDSITDQSNVSGWCKKTKVYDDKKTWLNPGNETKDLTSSSKTINEYNLYESEYNLLAPATFFGYNTDDGVFLGGGVLIKHQGFRKKPYANYQRIVANIAAKNSSFNFKYTGDFNNLIGPWGLNMDVAILAPKSVTNFFGIGNETAQLPSQPQDYYRVRYDHVHVFPALKRRFGNNHSFKIGPVYDYLKIEETPDKFISSVEAQPYIQDFSARNLGGLKLEYEFQNIDDTVMTRRGISWVIGAISEREFKNTTIQPTNLSGELNVYFPLPNKSTLAVRAGGATLLGDFEFYQANTLGGVNRERGSGNLRGSVRGRYSDRNVLYVNADLRITVLGFRTYIFPAYVGVLAFYDQGKVWNKSMTSNAWHTGYGGGFWLSPFGKAIVNLTYGISEESKLITVVLGFSF